MTTQTTSEQRGEVLRRLAHAADDVRAARARYLAEQEAAWQRYVAVVDKALADDLHLEERPEGTPTPVQELLDDVRGRVDELRLQGQLGKMELEDLAAHLRATAGHLLDLVRIERARST